MTVQKVLGPNLSGQVASSGGVSASSTSKFAGQILSAPVAQLASDTVSFSGKTQLPNQAQAGTTPALIRAAAAFAGGQAMVSAKNNGPSKSMADIFFGRSDSGSGLSHDQKVSGGGASAFGGGSNHT